MKQLLSLVLVSALLLFHFQLPLSVNSQTTAQTDQTESETKEELEKSVSKLEEEKILYEITSFDVSSSGLIAVCNDQLDNTINVYSQNGEFLYGYKCNFDGAFGVEFYDDTLTAYILRRNIIIALDTNAHITDIYEFEPTSENLDYWHHSIESTVKIKGDYEYRLKRGILSFYFSKLEKYDMNKGKSDIVIDFGNKSTLLTFGMFLIFIVAFIAVAIKLTKIIKENFINKSLQYK